MHALTFLILAGPCLIAAVAVVALLLAWRGLLRAPHVLAWAAGLGCMTVALVIRAFGIHEDGAALPWAAIAVQQLGCLTVILVTEGFAIRAGRWITPFGRRISAGAFVVLLGANLPGMPPALSGALAAAFQSIGLLWSARIVYVRSADSVAERLALGVLVLVGILRFATAAIGTVEMFGPPPPPGSDWIPAIMIQPACIGLLAMFLIASDLHGDLDRLARTDPLTGVMNRAGFEDAARAALRHARFPHRPLSVAIADLDRFKTINDDHGHAAGDAALTAFASAIGRALGGHALIGRIGGEEFALLLPAQDGYGALAVVEPIRALTETTKVDGHETIRLTASFGVAEMAHGEGLASLLARADAALYRSKRGGRNRCSLAACGAG